MTNLAKFKKNYFEISKYYNMHLKRTHPANMNHATMYKIISNKEEKLEALARKIVGRVNDPIEAAFKLLRNKAFIERYQQKKNIPRMKAYAKELGVGNNLNAARDVIARRANYQAKIIQRAFRASRLTNERKFKLALGASSPNRLSKYKQQRLLSVPINNMVRIKRERNASFRTPGTLKKITNIQRTFRGYKARVIDPRQAYLDDLRKDGRFDPYVVKLEKLQKMIPEVVRATRDGGAVKETIFKLISECHYSPRPTVMYRNLRLRDVRQKLFQMKQLKPREYLRRFLHQFSYVAREYAKMSPGDKALYRDRLESEAGSRPCLENLLESMVKVLIKPEFVWIGKAKNFENSPLMPDNMRYLGYGMPKPTRGLVNTAIQTWKNVPKNWALMNLDKRKNVFWGMIKNLPVSMVNNGTIVYGTPARYNRRGAKFRASNLSNMLNYIEPIYVEPPPAPMKRKRSPGSA